MFVDFWLEIYEVVRRNPSRTILTGIGIAWGIFILVLLTGIGSGFEKGIFSLFKGFSRSMTYLYASQTSIPYKGTNVNTKVTFMEEDLQALKEAIPDIEYSTPEAEVLETVFAGTKSGRFEVKGVYPEYFNIKLLEAEAGRILNILDMQETRKSIFVGKNVADVLFKKENPIGKEVRIGEGVYQIVGVIKNTLLNMSEERAIYMPYSTYRSEHSDAEHFSILLFSLKEKAKIENVKICIRNIMGRKYLFDPQDETVFYFNSMEDQMKAFSELFAALNKFLWFMGLSTLASGIIGVGNIMYVSAKERTREVGIRKSVGANPSQVKAMFLWESIALTSISGIVGMVVGGGILKFIGTFIAEDAILMEKPSVNLSVTVAAMCILVLCGTLVGLKPAIYASGLPPVEALKE